jgi:outer membrane protein, multidrug efflux system
MANTHLMAVCLLTGALAGCAGMGTRSAAAPVADLATATATAPAQWQHGSLAGPAPDAPPTALNQWWLGFDDPLMARWLAQALQANPGLQETRAALQQARAQRDLTEAGAALGLRASGSARRDANPGGSANLFRAGVDASWEADLFGAQRAAQAAADAEVATAVATLGQAQVSLAAEVALLTLEWRSAQARWQLAQDSLARLQDTLALTEWRQQAGLVSSLELAQAQATVAQARANLPALATSRTQALHALAVLTGQAPAALLAVAAPLPNGAAVPQPPPALALRLPADTLRQRPDVQAAEQRLRAAWARARQTEAERLPSFTLSGSLGLAQPRLSDLFDLSALTRSLLASVSATLLDGGAGAAREAVQQAALLRAQRNLEATVLEALKEVENVLVALQGQRQRLSALQDARGAAATTETLSRHRYAAGLTDLRNLLDAERALLGAETDLITTQTAWSADHVRLVKAVGGGWNPEP